MTAGTPAAIARRQLFDRARADNVPASEPGFAWLRSQLRSAPLIAFLLATTLVGCLLLFFLGTTYRDAEKAAEVSSRNEAMVLATRFGTTLRRVKASTDLTADRLADAKWA